MSNLSNFVNNIFSPDKFDLIIPSSTRNINAIYQTKEILIKLSWENDFLSVILITKI
jgi:hypothetical protein